MSNYQLDYAATRPQMYDQSSRIRKAERMVKTLRDYFDKTKLKKLSLLDIGSSTGIIDAHLAKKFGQVTGIDIDERAVNYAQKHFKRKNLHFKVGDAMKLNFRNNHFDIAVCAQVYEHVPDSQKLFNEIYRVLKPGGVCYLAALNRLWPWEPHYNLPFLSWLPKPLANKYVKLFGRAQKYYENPETYSRLKKMTKKFKLFEYTDKILKDPKKFGYEEVLKFPLSLIAKIISPLAKYTAPTFFWILVKPGRID